jgi:hypothetical protein
VCTCILLSTTKSVGRRDRTGRPAKSPTKRYVHDIHTYILAYICTCGLSVTFRARRFFVACFPDLLIGRPDQKGREVEFGV